MHASPPADHLPWDSEFFGQRIARARGNTLTPEEVDRLLAWCRAERVQCLYLLARADHPETERLAGTRGFVLVDRRVTLARSIGDGDEAGEEPGGLRSARLSDLPALRTIAATAHEESRFYRDVGFPKERCSELYQTWIAKSVSGWAQAVLVAERHGPAAGYISCHLDTPQSGRIGLVGVSSSHRGEGIGAALVAGAVRWFAGQRVRDISVVTQGDNEVALRLYRRAGFSTRTTEHWYHYRPRT